MFMKLLSLFEKLKHFGNHVLPFTVWHLNDGMDCMRGIYFREKICIIWISLCFNVSTGDMLQTL